MITRPAELCRKLRPVLGQRIDGLWAAYLAEPTGEGKADIEQTLELLAAKHLGQDFRPDRSPFPPPTSQFAGAGDIPLGMVSYAGKGLYPFDLRSSRLKEHLLICGRSGSGKTNATFVLMQGIMQRGLRVIAMDWKRSYRDLLQIQPDLRIYTIGRNISPFSFNPFIPPPGCEPHVWIKQIVDVIASAYLGGEGVISLLVAGLDHLYTELGVFAGTPQRWPTVMDLLAWLRTTKLTGRAAMWQASADRILLAMTYGEFGAVLNTQDNRPIAGLLNRNVVMEMDGLSSSADRVMFSEALTLYLYRYRLAQGPREELGNVIVLEEAHNLLLAKQTGSAESVLENSIRMIRQYGIGYVFVDQSASLLSKVAFSNCYGIIALSQKLRDDVRAIAGAMNLSDEQKDSLSTLPVGTAVVRLADEHPEAFLVTIPRSSVRDGLVTDEQVGYSTLVDSTDPSDSASMRAIQAAIEAVSEIPAGDKEDQPEPGIAISHHPASPTARAHPSQPPIPRPPPLHTSGSRSHFPKPAPPPSEPSNLDRGQTLAGGLSREAIRFLADVAARPLSTTVQRYERLHLSRRRGNAIRSELTRSGLIEGVAIATRSGQVVLHELTDPGRVAAERLDIDPGLRPRQSLEHRYWVTRVAEQMAAQGYEVELEHAVEGNGAIDLLAERGDERISIEVETGKSDIKANLAKIRPGLFSRMIVLATAPAAVIACQRAISKAQPPCDVELWTWLDVS